MRGKNIGLYIGGILSGIFMFLFAYPYYMWEHHTLSYFLRLIYGLILFFNFRKEKGLLTLLWVFLLFYFSVAVGSSVIATLVFVFANIFLLFAKTEFVSISYKTLYNVFVLFAILSIINYALFFMGFSMPNYQIEPLNETKNYDYTAYPFMLIANNFKGFIRFHGLFDEPGALSTYCFLFLWAERFEIFKWRNIVLMIAGVLTLSLFFYIAISVMMFIKVFSKGTSIWFRISVLSLMALFVYSLTVEDSITAMSIGQRLEYDEDKGFAGNNRSTSTLDVYYDKVSWKEPVFFLGPTLGGENKKKVESQVEGAAGYKRAFLEVGLLGCIYYSLFFMFYANKYIKKRKDIFLFVLCFLMTLYQRPFFTDVVYIFMFVSIIKLHEYQFNGVKESGQIIRLKRLVVSQPEVIK